MNLVNPNGTLSATKFKCLIKKQEYMVVGTNNNHTGEFFSDSVWKATDIVKRLSDGLKKSYTREEMKRRFKNINPCN